MRAVNLIPVETRRTKLDTKALRGPGPAAVAVLAAALVLVTMYVLASNTVAQRRAELTSLRQQLAQTQAESGSLTRYTQFAQLTRARVQTVREIAASRFDWAKALSDLARVVPANTTLDSLSATDNTSASAGGSSSGAGGLRGDINTPAFVLDGCTATQDNVARLMSRLRLIPGVTRVTLSDSSKDASSAVGSAVASSGCTSGAATFDLVVFFAGPASGPVPTTSAPTTNTSAPTSTTSAPTSTTSAPTSTTGGPTSTSSAPATTTPASSPSTAAPTASAAGSTGTAQ